MNRITEVRETTGASRRICAVILTYNAEADVIRCLDAVNTQTCPLDRILIVDNHSTDGTSEILLEAQQRLLNLDVITTDENLGPAGGFYVGIKAAFEASFDLLWLLDDDSLPFPSCLQHLMAAVDTRRDTIAWPWVEDEFGREKWGYPAWKGALVPRQIVEIGGLPNREFFWGVEDTEYFQHRLHGTLGFKPTLVKDARLRYTSSNRRKHAPWHYYYRTRNTLHYRLRLQRLRQWRKLASGLGIFWIRAIVKEDQKLLKSWYMVQGAYDAFRGRLGKTLDPTDSR